MTKIPEPEWEMLSTTHYVSNVENVTLVISRDDDNDPWHLAIRGIPGEREITGNLFETDTEKAKISAVVQYVVHMAHTS